jgi:hypothetical protein
MDKPVAASQGAIWVDALSYGPEKASATAPSFSRAGTQKPCLHPKNNAPLARPEKKLFWRL